MRLQLVTTRESQPDYLSLPLDTPLAEWPDELLHDIPVGVHRHVVRFLAHEGRLYALKELPGHLADREWRLLRHLAEEDLPVVEVLGVIADRGGDLEDILVTRHLEFSLPFRFLFAQSRLPQLTASLVDAICVLVVRLHLEGFFWGDCSLSNTLFRRDAGSLSAYVVDVETGELHPQLSDGQREYDLELARTNIAGGLLDLQASGMLPDATDPFEVVDLLAERYHTLWAELTVEDHVDDAERWRIDERLRRLNDLGFDTAEIQILADGTQVRFRPVVVEAGHHRRRLERLTGVEAQENQARRLLNDLWSFKAHREGLEGRSLPEAVAAYRWLTEVYEPALATIPAHLADRREPAETFHEILAHRDRLVAERQAEVKVPDAATDYVSTILPDETTERSLLED